jgi:hypothetical protein
LDEDTKLYGILQTVHLPATMLAFAGTFALVRTTFFRLSGPVKDLLDLLQLALILAAIIGIALAVIDYLFDFASSRRRHGSAMRSTIADSGAMSRRSASPICACGPGTSGR